MKPVQGPPEAWEFCRTCLAYLGLMLAAVAWSFAWLPLGFDRFLSADAFRDMGRFVGEFLPPDVSADFLAKVGRGALETLGISAVGTLLAVLGGALLALPAAGRQGPAAKAGARFTLNLLRSVPELVWATLMVLAAGLGPFAGTLALALHTSGVLGRLFAEALENAPPGPAAALAEAGAGRLATFAYGTLPLVLPQWVAYALYRWEMNIRMAAILGFVGAGGLGALLYYELSLLHHAQASTVILGMLLLVVLVDAASAWVRGRMQAAGS